jgi:hypothetical protein
VLHWIAIPESVPKPFNQADDIEVVTFPDVWLPPGLHVAIAPVCLIYLDTLEAVRDPREPTDCERPALAFAMHSRGVLGPVEGDRNDIILAALHATLKLEFTHLYQIQCVTGVTEHERRIIVRGVKVKECESGDRSRFQERS